jgi:motility quorum-sensing regulator/GCU-specific mRNA interferase toxin
MRRAHEKSRRTYDLDEVKALVQDECLILPKPVLKDALSLGFTRERIGEVILELAPSDFYKSMTEHISRNEIYLDVYHKQVDDYILYIKFKISKGVLLVVTSFKER